MRTSQLDIVHPYREIGMTCPRRRISPDRRFPALPPFLSQVGFLLLVALPGGCLPGSDKQSQEQPDSSVTLPELVSGSDTAEPGPAAVGMDGGAGLQPSSQALSADTGHSTGDTAGGTENAPQPSEAPPRAPGNPPRTPDPSTESNPGTQVQETPLDSLRTRLQELEAENDSLRAAVGIILSAMQGEQRVSNTDSAGNRSDSLSAPADGQEEVLDVDRAQVRNWGLRIAVALGFMLLTGILVRTVTWVLDRLAERSAKRRLLFKRLVPIFRILTWFLAVLFIALVVLRVDTQGLLAAGAAVGVAVGFAAQDILKNVFGGLIVVFDQPFQVGDKISVSGTYGEVVSIGLRSTRIVTPDDNLVSVPNAQIVGGQVANANAGELNCQVVTDLFLPGWVDEAKAKDLAFQAAASSRYVFRNKPIVVLVKDEFKETFLTHLKVKAYVLDPRYEFLFMSDVTERARAAFRDAGLIGAMHGARAWVDLDRFREGDDG